MSDCGDVGDCDCGDCDCGDCSGCGDCCSDCGDCGGCGFCGCFGDDGGCCECCNNDSPGNDHISVDGHNEDDHGSRCHCSVCFFLTTDDDCCDDSGRRERRRRRDLTYTVTSQGQPRQNAAARQPEQNDSSSPEIQNSDIPMQTLQNNSEKEGVITSQPPSYDEATNSVVTSQPV